MCGIMYASEMDSKPNKQHNSRSVAVPRRLQAQQKREINLMAPLFSFAFMPFSFSMYPFVSLSLFVLLGDFRFSKRSFNFAASLFFTFKSFFDSIPSFF